MAALAVPLVEVAVSHILAALGIGVAAGVGVAGGAAIEQARKRQEEAEKAKSVPILRTESIAQSRTKCKECPPDKGVPFQRNFAVRKSWVDYQARITGMPNGPTFIMEWKFNNVDFDGFVSAECLLQEAKADYDQFFDIWNDFKYDFQKVIFIKMTEDAVKQNLIAIPKPPVRLRWYFQMPVSYRYMQRILQTAAPQIEVVFQP
jgi:hypothetical protein